MSRLRIAPLMRSLALPVLVGAAALSAAACSTAGAPNWTYPPAAPAAPVVATHTTSARTAGSAALTAMSMPMGGGAGVQAAAAAVHPAASPQAEPRAVPYRLDMTIVTGDMIGHTEYPAFVPADVTLPANATVVVTITNFDDATSLPKGSEQYARVTGTAGGTAAVTPIRAADPNTSAAPTRTISSLDPADVSHTLTIPGLGVNVPIAPHSRETFTIHTGAPGVYAWHCMDPCGDGPNGWGTAMAARKGFMEGTITVAG